MSDQMKEAVTIAVESSSSLAPIINSILAGIASFGLLVTGYVHRRFKKIEEAAVTSSQLNAHIEDENKKFDALFVGHRELLAITSDIRESVAKIEGWIDAQP